MWFYTLVKIVLLVIAAKAIYNLMVHADKPLSGTEIQTGPSTSTKTGSQVYDEMMAKMRRGK